MSSTSSTGNERVPRGVGHSSGGGPASERFHRQQKGRSGKTGAANPAGELFRTRANEKRRDAAARDAPTEPASEIFDADRLCEPGWFERLMFRFFGICKDPKLRTDVESMSTQRLMGREPRRGGDQ